MSNWIRLVILICLALYFSACKGAGGAGSASFSDVAGPLPGTPVTLKLKTGHGFSCFALSDSIFCSGHSADHDLAINSSGFERIVLDSDSSIISLELWDDTICFSTQVQDRPYNGDPGLATYCMGEATWTGAYIADPIVYGSSPGFSWATHGSPDLSVSRPGIAGGDIPMTNLTGGTWIVDGTAFVSESDLSCELSADGATLTCPTFEVSL